MLDILRCCMPLDFRKGDRVGALCAQEAEKEFGKVAVGLKSPRFAQVAPAVVLEVLGHSFGVGCHIRGGVAR